MLRVRDKKTGGERLVTKKAYQILSKRYQLLEDLGDQNTEPAPELKSGRLPNVSAQLHQKPAVTVQPVAKNAENEVVGIQVNPVPSDEKDSDWGQPEPEQASAFDAEPLKANYVGKKRGPKTKNNA